MPTDPIAWEIRGLDLETGTQRRFQVRAATEAEARDKAESARVAVELCRPAEGHGPPAAPPAAVSIESELLRRPIRTIALAVVLGNLLLVAIAVAAVLAITVARSV